VTDEVVEERTDHSPGIDPAPEAAAPHPEPSDAPGAPGAPADAAPAAPAPPGVVTADLPVDVVCPTCGTPARVDGVRRESADFCATCDYPLFWAVERHPAALNEGSDTGLRRLPGTAGRASLAALRCPSCTEPNAPSATHCARCGAELRPAPVVVELPPEPEPEPEPVVVVVPPPPWWQSWWAIGGAIGLVVLVDVIVLLLVF
jgi:rubredoxin